MKIAILGGRFDPPHLGHLWVASQVLDYVTDVSEVILVPAHEHQWKKTEVSGKQRLEMVSMLKGDRISVSDIELERKGVSYSIDTIRAIKEETKSEVYWIIGSDILGEFHRWDRAAELFKEAEFLVFPRDPYHIPSDIPEEFKVIRKPDLITSSISSTVLRERLKQGLSIEKFVPKPVNNYIVEHSLYK